MHRLILRRSTFEGDKLASGIEKLSKAVKSTLGPSGQTVLIESPQHTHGITVTKDGVTVAKARLNRPGRESSCPYDEGSC